MRSSTYLAAKRLFREMYGQLEASRTAKALCNFRSVPAVRCAARWSGGFLRHRELTRVWRELSHTFRREVSKATVLIGQLLTEGGGTGSCRVIASW